MSKMISVASNFQYSVNIGYDLNNEDKLKNFIPTQSALNLLKDILQSTKPTSTDRARVLIGAYGKGKSHIVLTILSILMKKDLSSFVKLMPKVNEDPYLLQLVNNYYDSDNKIFPVVITGSNTSLTQAFLLALQRTLSDFQMMDIMPETNYKAAVSVISKWKLEFPDTFQKFSESIDSEAETFIERLNSFDITAYEQFEAIYPKLTSGSVFNPFLGFDVVELYENVAKGLKAKGFSGIYVIYDEFSKYLEANIVSATVSDTKTLQDFAEKCNRSGNIQLHLMLISHKEISNYIDKLPKQKVDGWKGVSERFKHIHLSNNFNQTYEIISSVIQKSDDMWVEFQNKFSESFSSLRKKYSNHPVFSSISKDFDSVLYGCFPLHPLSTFILPRLSERVAQNERTLFTFLSADGKATLPDFLAEYEYENFSLVTPDIIFDYFELLFQKEDYASYIHTNYVLTNRILNQISTDELECKIVKTISLIYILEQFENLKPTVEEIVGIYSTAYDTDSIKNAIDDLINKDYVVYLKRSNNFLKLKETSGVDIKQKINDKVQQGIGFTSLKSALNNFNFDNYIYPSRYNDTKEMTRYFSFNFIDSNEVDGEVNWNIKRESIKSDGVIYGVILHNEDDFDSIRNKLIKSSKNVKSCIFVLPKHYSEIESTVKEMCAVATLRDEASGDDVLFNEYDLIYDDLNEVIRKYIFKYTHPESFESVYIYGGEICQIKRKASLTELMSVICDNVYCKTPVINNEALNRDEITTVSSNSRAKILAALLRNELEPNLGLSGTGQEVSIMRSTLIRTNILHQKDNGFEINLHTGNDLIDNTLSVIEKFILNSRSSEAVSFAELYCQLMSEDGGIGLRKGLIPIYLAAVIHCYKNQVVISSTVSQETITADLLLQINTSPENYSVSYLDWSHDTDEYIDELTSIFSDYIVESEQKTNSYAFIANAMHRWYMSLPKYAKEAKAKADGTKIPKKHISFIKSLKQNNSDYSLLFKELPQSYGSDSKVNSSIALSVKSSKILYDGLLNDLNSYLVEEIKEIFSATDSETLSKSSLCSVIQDWCNGLEQQVYEQLFSDGTDKYLAMFKTVTNDEYSFVSRLAKLVTGLRLEDWDGTTKDSFIHQLVEHKKTAESFYAKDNISNNDGLTSNYQFSFADKTGNVLTKRFDKVDVTPRGKLLENQIHAALSSMGHSINENEKRQILVEILKTLC